MSENIATVRLIVLPSPEPPSYLVRWSLITLVKFDDEVPKGSIQFHPFAGTLVVADLERAPLYSSLRCNSHGPRWFGPVPIGLDCTSQILLRDDPALQFHRNTDSSILITLPDQTHPFDGQAFQSLEASGVVADEWDAIILDRPGWGIFGHVEGRVEYRFEGAYHFTDTEGRVIIDSRVTCQSIENGLRNFTYHIAHWGFDSVDGQGGIEVIEGTI